MRNTARLLAPLTLALLLAFCSSNPRSQQAGQQPDTYVSVDNQSTLDMNIYVLRGAQRIRLGTATAHMTTRLRLPRDVVFGITSLRFLADPIGSSRTPVSQEIAVTAGDEIVLRIPPGT